MNRSTFAVFTVLCVLVLAAAAAAQVRAFRTVPGDMKNVVQFVSEATLERIVGRTREISGSVSLDLDNLAATTEGKFEVDLRTLDTGIGLRNQHMRDNHLHTNKYPSATFTLGRFVSVNREQLLPGEPVSVLAEGEFKIHGISKMYQIPLTLTYYPSGSSPEASERLSGGSGDLVTVRGEWMVRLADHEISRPEFLFMRLAEAQKVTVSFAVTDAPESGQ